ncbi:hypothetical protein C8J57DRAFT_1527836 [Mycena rebaudengoi]|nr:hypothetical protein C8J57DRAFT_1527836 [Mycena rebaudengoi]
MSSPPSSQANPPIATELSVDILQLSIWHQGHLVYDSNELCSKDHLGIAHAAYYTTNLNQAMVTILRKPDELECFFDDCEFVSATKHRLKEHLKGMHQFFATVSTHDTPGIPTIPGTHQLGRRLKPSMPHCTGPQPPCDSSSSGHDFAAMISSQQLAVMQPISPQQ